MNADVVIAAERNLRSGDSPWVFAALALVILPTFVALGVYMAWRPEEFVRRSRVFKASNKPMLPGAVVGTRLFGIVVLGFVLLCVGTLVVDLLS